MFERANWIGCGTDMGDICPEFMCKVEVTGERRPDAGLGGGMGQCTTGSTYVKSAELFISAIGVYEAFLNGVRIGDYVLAPGCTVYRERLQYQKYDVKNLLSEENILTVTVGPGWHRGRISKGSEDINHMPAAVIACLEIVYEDGRKESIVTDENWKVRKSRILFSDLYDGEIYNAAAPDEEYGNVKVLTDLGKERLLPQEGEKICEHERLKPLRFFVTPAGERVIDFGQNLAGYVELHVNAQSRDGKVQGGTGNACCEGGNAQSGDGKVQGGTGNACCEGGNVQGGDGKVQGGAGNACCEGGNVQGGDRMAQSETGNVCNGGGNAQAGNRKAQKGDRIVISHAEILDKDGNIYTENYRTAQAKLTYICGEGEQTYKPHLAFYGFRYIRLDEYPEEVDLNDFTAIAVYSDMKRTGYMECGHEGINRLYENTIWSQRSNFIDIPTDCPQRDERMGWTGDAQVFCRTASYNYHVGKFFSKWLSDVRAEQYEDGMICDVVPDYWKMRRGSTAWGDVITIAPWQMYLTYGDRKVLEDNFDAMKKWVDYMTKDSAHPYLWTCGDEQKKLWGKHYGDWLAQDAPYGSYIGATDVDLIASAFYAHSVALLVKTGKVLGWDMAAYEELHHRIVETFRKTFELKTQTANVLALQFGLTDHPEETAARLAQMIRDNGNRLQTGFVGTPYLLHVLSENGYGDAAYDLLFQEAFPSWLYEVNRGATTIWEHWDGVRDDGTIWSKDMNSYNHYAYGCVMDWLYGVAGGIRPVEEYPGFEKVLLQPVPDRRLGWLKVSLETARGVIRSSWVYQEDRVRYEISTPVDAVVVIDGKEYRVGRGEYIFFGTAR